MLKWIVGIIALAIIIATGYWFSIDKNVRYLILNQPSSPNALFWTIPQRDAAFQSVDKLGIMPKREIKKGQVQPDLTDGEPLTIDEQQLSDYFEKQRIAGLVVIQDGKIRLEKYALGLEADGKWTSFSVAKSFTSTLVGAAIKDGYINSLDDKVSDYIPDMKGSEYDQVSVEQLLTMTSGIAWNEDYDDPESDVSKFNYHTPDEGVDITVSYMRQLPRARKAGSQWLYSTGETNLIGLLVSEATGKTVSDYLSEKVWSKIGVEQDASWLLGPTDHEISGCCIQASTRDFARFAQFILNGAKVNDESIVPDYWFELATTTQADIGRPGSGYGFQWWTYDDGTFEGKGIFGQGLLLDKERNLVIAINSNWPVASASEFSQSRAALYKMIQSSIDKEMVR